MKQISVRWWFVGGLLGFVFSIPLWLQADPVIVPDAPAEGTDGVLNPFIAGQPAKAAEVMHNFKVLAEAVNALSQENAALKQRVEAIGQAVKVSNERVRIGAGTALPEATLHVSNEPHFNAQLYLESVKPNSSSGGMRLYGEGDGAGGTITFGGEVASHSATNSPTMLTSDSTGRHPGIYRYFAHPNASDSGHMFGSTPRSADPQDIRWHMVVRSNGNVGIGTDDPRQALTVAGSNNISLTHPDGLHGIQPVTAGLSNPAGTSTPYTVPDGKNLYVTNIFDDVPLYWRIDGITIKSLASAGVQYGRALVQPLILGPGQVLSGGGSFNGYLVDAIVQPVTAGLSNPAGTSTPYTVPDGKNLYVTNIFDDVPLYWRIDGITIKSLAGAGVQYGRALGQPLILGPGQVLSGGGSFNGYLRDVD